MRRRKRKRETGKGKGRKENKGLERNVYMFVGFFFALYSLSFSFDAFVGAVVFAYFVAYGRGGWG